VTIATNIGIILSLLFLGLQYRQNTELLAIERSTVTSNSRNQILELVIQDPSLIELMGKDPSTLTQVESDRLMVLGLLNLLNQERIYATAVASGHLLDGPVDERAVAMRAIYYRPRLNYGMPHAWEMHKSRGETDFTRWFEKEVIGQPP
jgi:hypothetical protein